MKKTNNKYALIITIIICILLLLFIYTYLNIFHIYKWIAINTLNKSLINDRYGLRLINHKDQIVIFESKQKHNMITLNIFNEQDFFKSIVRDGEVGLGESYTRKSWDTTQLVELFVLLCLNQDKFKSNSRYSGEIHSNNLRDSEQVAHHYDVGNDFYAAFLTDSLMAYTCAIWLKDTDTLEIAQKRKVDYIIRKLDISPGEQILDIGCGWGRIGQYIQQENGVFVDGVTISKEQAKYIRDNNLLTSVQECHFLDMPEDKIYDKAYSICMIEHIRSINYIAYFEKVKRLLKNDGKFVLQAIMKIPASLDDLGQNGEKLRFMSKHIFPGGEIPTTSCIEYMAQKAGLRQVYGEVFGGQHYARTLREWRNNMLNNAKNTVSIETLRAYDYYFASCEGAFLTGDFFMSHYVFEKI